MTSGRLNALARLAQGPARLVYGNRASRIYLAVVAATAVFVAVDTLFVHHDDASFAGVWLFFLAAPTVFLFFAAWIDDRRVVRLVVRVRLRGPRRLRTHPGGGRRGVRPAAERPARPRAYAARGVRREA